MTMTGCKLQNHLSALPFRPSEHARGPLSQLGRFRTCILLLESARALYTVLDLASWASTSLDGNQVNLII